jgi:hypothetical protein
MGIGDGDLVAKSIATALIAPAFGTLGTAIGGAIVGSDMKKAGDYDKAVDEALALYAEDSNLFTN